MSRLAVAAALFCSGLVGYTTHTDPPTVDNPTVTPTATRPTSSRAYRGMRRRPLYAASHRTDFPGKDRRARTSRHPAPRQVAVTHDWSSVAQCESGGNWSINTGNGYYGGLQFTEQSWAGMGGLAYAARPDLASETAQIIVAERLLAVQGVGAWPRCGVYLRAAA